MSYKDKLSKEELESLEANKPPAPLPIRGKGIPNDTPLYTLLLAGLMFILFLLSR